MSRTPGRRGGGGRGKAGSHKTARIGGMEIPYDDVLDDSPKGRPQPAPLFPEYQPAEPQALTQKEQQEVGRFLSIREKFRNGPLYANLGAGPDTRQTNPFEDMGAYSQKYIQRTRTIPMLGTKPRAINHYPDELLPAIDPKGLKTNGMVKATRQPEKRLPPTDHIKLEDINDDDDVEEIPEDEMPEPEVDDEYGSDEEEMAGDYNAEQYFDNGGEEAGDDFELDGGDGGDAFN